MRCGLRAQLGPPSLRLRPGPVGTHIMRLALLLLVGTLLVSAVAMPRVAGRGPKVGDVAPQISAPQWRNHLGRAPSLADLRGHVVLVEFWATW